MSASAILTILVSNARFTVGLVMLPAKRAMAQILISVSNVRRTTSVILTTPVSAKPQTMTQLVGVSMMATALLPVRHVPVLPLRNVLSVTQGRTATDTAGVLAVSTSLVITVHSIPAHVTHAAFTAITLVTHVPSVRDILTEARSVSVCLMRVGVELTASCTLVSATHCVTAVLDQI
jgi:hypothetical protein